MIEIGENLSLTLIYLSILGTLGLLMWFIFRN